MVPDRGGVRCCFSQTDNLLVDHPGSILVNLCWSLKKAKIFRMLPKSLFNPPFPDHGMTWITIAEHPRAIWSAWTHKILNKNLLTKQIWKIIGAVETCARILQHLLIPCGAMAVLNSTLILHRTLVWMEPIVVSKWKWFKIEILQYCFDIFIMKRKFVS